MPTAQFRGFANTRLTAQVRGDENGPPVLLIHGIGQTHKHWDEVAAALDLTGRRVINLDLRGHGNSEWPSDARYDFDAFVDDIKSVLAQLGGRPVVIASSFSGWLAVAALGEAAGDLAAALVLVDTPPNTCVDGAGMIGDELHKAGFAQSSKDWDPLVIERICNTIVPSRLEAAAANLKLPVLVVRGNQDQAEKSATAIALHAAVPHAEIVELVEFKAPLQLAQLDCAEAFNGLLLDFLERRAPLAPPEYREGSDARTFRDALGCFATGVTIVTAFSANGEPIGLTANSFTSVSLDPPLLLVCIAKNAGTAAVLQSCQQFAVNVLQIGQQPTSNRFAGKGEDRFAATDWSVGEYGTPVVSGSLASFECERHALHDGGDHFILIGRVLKAMFEPRRDPLLYFRGKYRRLHFA